MHKKKTQVGKTILWGALSVGLYAAIFSRGTTVAHLFSQGSWYAVLPVATVFLFSVVHGTFASYLWSLLGIEAKKKLQPRPKAEKRAVRRKRPRPQPQLHA